MSEAENESLLPAQKAIEQVIESFSEEEREKVVAVLEMTMMSYGGPIMPPPLLRELEKIVPGGAERALRLTEKEQDHRHRVVEVEAATERWQIKASLIGGMIAFGALVVGILYCAICGYTAGIVALGGIGAFGVVSHIIRLPKKGAAGEADKA